MRGGQLSLSEELAGPVAPGSIEERLYLAGYACIAGLDEVGRGPLAGPVVAAAVIFPRGFFHPGIKDSKSLNPCQREELVPVIKQCAVDWAVGTVDAGEIDRINILNASLRAMSKALRHLRQAPDCLLIDGNRSIPVEWLNDNGIGFKGYPHQKTVIGGDRLCVAIAAASIIAKVARDAVMVELGKRYPEYGFACHKGYGSSTHLEALRRHGPCPEHRQSFRPVRQICGDPGEAILPLFGRAAEHG